MGQWSSRTRLPSARWLLEQHILQVLLPGVCTWREQPPTAPQGFGVITARDAWDLRSEVYGLLHRAVASSLHPVSWEVAVGFLGQSSSKCACRKRFLRGMHFAGSI